MYICIALSLPVETERTVSHYQKQWAELTIKRTMLHSMIDSLTSVVPVSICHQSDMLLPGYRRSAEYRPLLSRTTCSSLEDRKEYYAKRRKLDKYLNTDADKASDDINSTTEPTEGACDS